MTTAKFTRTARYASCALLLVASCSPPPQTVEISPDMGTAFIEARRLHLSAVEGDAAAVELARAYWEELHRLKPDDPRIRAWLGSVRLLQAREASMPWSKGSLASEGLELLDSALKKYPLDVELRFLRGVSARELPSFFGRSEQARADLDYAFRELSRAHASGEIDEEMFTWIAGFRRDGSP